jgi:UDP-glucose 4-epimerase
VTLIDSLIPEYGGNLFNVADIEGRIRVNISDVRDMHALRYLVQGRTTCSTWPGRPATSIR